MATTFPALRARMGDLEYYVVITTVGEATRTVQYVEEVDDWGSETPPELKLQRKLNVQRVEREMVPYLLDNGDHFYSALTVEVRPIPDAAPGQAAITFEGREKFPGGIEFGVVLLDGTESLYALDGQHRLKSMELAIKQQPQLAREQIALLLVPFQTVHRSQSLFSDLNRYARAPSKSISLLFTHREALARITKRLCGVVPLLKDRVNMETTTLSKNARQFITLSTLYEMTKALIGQQADADDLDEDSAVEELARVWEVMAEGISEWRLVADDEEHPAYLRPQYLNMHGVCQQAIAFAVGRARSDYPESWMGVVTESFKGIDWRLTNPKWQQIALHGGRVNNTTTSIRNLAGLLEAEMGIEPEARRAEAIRTAFELQRIPLPAVLQEPAAVGTRR